MQQNSGTTTAIQSTHLSGAHSYRAYWGIARIERSLSDHAAVADVSSRAERRERSERKRSRGIPLLKQVSSNKGMLRPSGACPEERSDVGRNALTRVWRSGGSA